MIKRAATVHDPNQQPKRPLRWSAGGFRGTVHPDWQSIFANTEPLAWIAHSSVEQLSDRPSSKVDRCQTDRGIVFAKVMTAATDNATQSRAVLPKLKWTLRWSRARVTMRTSWRMERAGIHCAPVVFAARKRSGLGATDVLISSQVQGESLLSALRREDNSGNRAALVQRAAEAIKRLHEHGFMHGDLHPNNIILQGPAKDICFIDNDRTRHWAIGLPWVFRMRNLEQMAYRLLRINEEETELFLEAYLCGVSSSRRNRSKRAVLEKASSRVEQFHAKRVHARTQGQSDSN